METQESREHDRYSAKLLFQYRVLAEGKPNVMRTCEERMIVLRAKSAHDALTAAKRHGKNAEFRHKNPAGHRVFFEFVGVLDLLHLGPECEPDEVWYDIKVMKLPKERAQAILPADAKLNAIHWANVNAPSPPIASKGRTR